VLLRYSAAARTNVVAAIRGVAGCTLAPGAALQQLDWAARVRRALLADARSATVSAIPAGSSLRAGLVRALRLSTAADRDFGAWMRAAEQQGISCAAGSLSQGPYLAGLRESARADNAKAAFLQQWDPLARLSGQPVFSAGQI
jgi:hypothetical protein